MQVRLLHVDVSVGRSSVYFSGLTKVGCGLWPDIRTFNTHSIPVLAFVNLGCTLPGLYIVCAASGVS